MKKAVIVVLAMALVMSIGIGSAFAANSMEAGTIGININTSADQLVSGKYFISNSMALLAGLGIGANGGDAKGTDMFLLVGARKYLSTNDFAPFAGGKLEYSSTNDSCIKNMSLSGEFGAEYFLHKQFSLEGSVGFGYSSHEETAPLTPLKTTLIGTKRAGLSANFYF